MYETIWYWRPNDRCGVSQGMVRGLLFSLLSVLVGLLLLARTNHQRRVPPRLYRHNSVALDRQACDLLISRVQLYLRRRAPQKCPAVPAWLRRQARLLAANPVAYRDFLLSKAHQAERLRLMAICYCLKSGLDKKHTMVAFQYLEQQQQAPSLLLKQILLTQGPAQNTVVSTSWIAYPGDQRHRPWWMK